MTHLIRDVFISYLSHDWYIIHSIYKPAHPGISKYSIDLQNVNHIQEGSGIFLQLGAALEKNVTFPLRPTSVPLSRTFRRKGIPDAA